MENKSHRNKQFIRMISMALSMVIFTLLLLMGICSVLIIGPRQITSIFSAKEINPISIPEKSKPVEWRAPDLSLIPQDETGQLIIYGRELIMHTSRYLGPHGSVMSMSNGMNCQNCHLDAGTKPYGNNYSAVASTYPKFRARSGKEENIEKRINDCFERSLNGQSLKVNSHEMKAIKAYIQWVGKDVDKGKSPKGVGLMELTYLDRPANAELGKLVYEKHCVLCHGITGGGLLLADSSEWQYPPLWGKKSYNIGAGLYRLSRFAGYVKANMPLGTTYDAPILTDAEAWDVAAYVNSLQRPSKDLSKDWPDISRKPIDHPFGPFADDFDETQHKFGPFIPIQESRKILSSSKK